MRLRMIQVGIVYPSPDSSYKELRIPARTADILRIRGMIREYKSWFVEEEKKWMLRLRDEVRVKKYYGHEARIRLIGRGEKETIALIIPIVPSAIAGYIVRARNMVVDWLARRTIVLHSRPLNTYILSVRMLGEFRRKIRQSNALIDRANSLLYEWKHNVTEKIGSLIQRYNVIDVEDQNYRKFINDIETFSFHHADVIMLPLVIYPGMEQELGISREEYMEMVKSFVKALALDLSLRIREDIRGIAEGDRVYARIQRIRREVSRISSLAAEIGIDSRKLSDAIEELINMARRGSIPPELDEAIASRLW